MSSSTTLRLQQAIRSINTSREILHTYYAATDALVQSLRETLDALPTGAEAFKAKACDAMLAHNRETVAKTHFDSARKDCAAAVELWLAERMLEGLKGLVEEIAVRDGVGEVVVQNSKEELVRQLGVSMGKEAVEQLLGKLQSWMGVKGLALAWQVGADGAMRGEQGRVGWLGLEQLRPIVRKVTDELKAVRDQVGSAHG